MRDPARQMCLTFDGLVRPVAFKDVLACNWSIWGICSLGTGLSVPCDVLRVQDTHAQPSFPI